MKMQSYFLRLATFGLLIGGSHAFKLGVKGLRGSEVGHPNASVNALQVTNAQDVVHVKAAQNRNSDRDRASFEHSLVRSVIKERLSISGAITRGDAAMTPDEAIRRLDGKLPPEVASLVHLTQHKKETSDSSGEFSEVSLAKARKILNGMIEGSWTELDDTLIECKEFEERNRETYQQVVGDLARLTSTIASLEEEMAASNNGIEEADSSRGTTSESQEKLTTDYDAEFMINSAEMTRRKADLAVFDFILNMTRCKDGSFLQIVPQVTPGVKVCENNGGLEFHFQDKSVESKLLAMMTPSARKSIEEALGVMTQKSSFFQRQAPNSGNQTVAEPPTAAPETLPVVETPDPAGQWTKCTQDPNCGLLHDTMSLQWGKFRDLVDSLQFEMNQNEDKYKKGKANLNDVLKMYTNQKAQYMVALSDSTAKRDTDVAESGDKNEQRRDLQAAWEKKMRECDAKMSEILLTNICAVKSVRNEVMEFSSVSPPSKIADCDVKDWTPQECSVACDDACPHPSDPYQCGGWQTLTRAVVVKANGFGIQCPPLARKKKCNQFKCAVNCGMSSWSGWSRCTKDCEGGVQSKTRSIIVKPKNGGDMCDTVQETRPCNTGSCDRNCKLEPWSDWSPCTMACSGGVQERARTVLIPIRGMGKCPKRKNSRRWQEQECNAQDCVGDEIGIATQDLILLLDGSGSLREEGFNTMRTFAANITDNYQTEWLGNPAMQIGAILFGNGHVEPDGTITPAIRVTGLVNNTATVKADIQALKWQRGFTNLAQAFVLADVLLQQGGRPGAMSAVMVIWDGKFSFQFETGQKARMLKEKNVQIYMAVVNQFLGQDEIKAIHNWASHPWETNYVHVPGLLDLENNMDTYLQKVLVKFSPMAYSPSQHVKMDDMKGYTVIKKGGVPNTKCVGGRALLVSLTNSPDDCATIAREFGASVFIIVNTPRGPQCKTYINFQDVDIATYNTWKTSKVKIVLTCKSGKEEFANEKNGWGFKARKGTTYALQPVSDF